MATYLVKPAVPKRISDIRFTSAPSTVGRRTKKRPHKGRLLSCQVKNRTHTKIEEICALALDHKVLPILSDNPKWFFRTHAALHLLKLKDLPKCLCCGSPIHLSFVPYNDLLVTKFGGFESFCSLECADRLVSRSGTQDESVFSEIIKCSTPENVEKFLLGVIKKIKSNSEIRLAQHLGVSCERLISVVKEYRLQSLLKGNSRCEILLIQYLREIGVVNISHQDRKILGDGREIDIYLPDLKIGIEHNGQYWHRPAAFNSISDWREYHTSKETLCDRKGIKLLHLWENHADHKKLILAAIHNNTINNDLDTILQSLYGVKHGIY